MRPSPCVYSAGRQRLLESVRGGHCSCGPKTMRGAKSNGEQIRAARFGRGFTQEQLAALAELDVKTVRKAEQGRRLDLGSLTRLAHALQSDLSRLIRPGRSNSDREVRRREHIMRWHRLWDAEDSDGLIALYHENAVLHLPG